MSTTCPPNILHLPNEMLALIADFVYEFNDLGNMMLACKILRNGVLLSRRWMIVQNILSTTTTLDIESVKRILNNRHACVVHACEKGMLRTIRALELSTFEANRPEVVNIVCEFGHMECLQYLHHEYDLQDIHKAQRYGSSAFQRACWGGHVDIVEYLHVRSGVTLGDVRSDRVLFETVRGRNARPTHTPCLEVLRYLNDHFPLHKQDVLGAPGSVFSPFTSACGDGALHVLKFFHLAFELTVEDIRVDHNSSLRYAAMYGRLNVIRYLHTEFGLTTEDARACHNEALTDAATRGHANVVHYLRVGFGLTAEDAAMCFDGYRWKDPKHIDDAKELLRKEFQQ
eukprot:TRINITY_DN12932_c0_g1_i1.p1 TRINITY_DN12932_c0_g1~~TRINITY_DN12932_c0_g1_i1.p1  ORF type:complete len:342 (-),score=67.18 TRINITY_DN12932_c0_g1_i1:48-1073(-)